VALTRWTNPSLPQTLQIAVFLFYIRGVFAVLFAAGDPAVLLPAAAGVTAGLGIANEAKWGYRLAQVVTSINVALLLWLVAVDLGNLVDIDFLFIAIFPVAMFAAVWHPLSREHQRIWFR
jgi:hypothetical protein